MSKIISLFILLIPISFFANSAVILQYHHVSDSSPKSTSISPELFLQHLDYIQNNNYEVVSLNTVMQALKAKQTINDNWVVITFDDAYKDVLTHAHEALVTRNFPYSIFVNPDSIDLNTSAYLSWDELNLMAKEGVEINNHSLGHLHLVRQLDNENKQQWKTRIKQNILEAQRQISEKTGQNNRSFAYPYGEYNFALQQILSELNLVGIGQHSGAVDGHNDLTQIPRFPVSSIYANLETLKVKLNTLAFNIKDQPKKTIQKNQNPEMTITLEVNDFNPDQLLCYAGSEVMTPTWIDKQTFTVQAMISQNVGRSRYSCTARSINKPDYYYWFSQPWMILNSDGSWYE
ncbi:MAG: polysaccharide deacetylase family protein [Saccharospirillaceae bacterium]|nr:polysaccharide deacetylase family protein [Pseudomonadales bacterium]NRB81308.1 polysaccharide deacetylase family protein [Saccharospirillaceae bacterium]